MDTPPPAITPPEPLPQVASAPPPPPPIVPPGSLLPPPSYSPVIQAAPRKKLSARAVTFIVLGSVAVGVLVIGGVIAGALAISSSVTETIAEVTEGIEEFAPPIVNDPLVEGDPSTAYAEQPLDCAEACFTGAHISGTITDPDDPLLLDLPNVTEKWGDYDASSPHAEYSYTAAGWKEREGSPDECFFTYFFTPVAVGYDERPGVSTDPIHFTGMYQDDSGYTVLNNSTRLFADSASARAHMESLVDRIAGCPGYELGSGADYWGSTLTLAPRLELPEDVAATGWVEVAPTGRFYVFDVQRANLVVRTTFNTPGQVSEREFREYVERLAEQIGALEPSPAK